MFNFFFLVKMPRKRPDFSHANLENAINAVLNEGLSKKSAALKFKVSRSTLQHRLKNPESKTTCGPATVLSCEEETILEKWIHECCKKGFPQRKEDLQLSVKQFLDKNQRTSSFLNNYPGNFVFNLILFKIIMNMQ